MINSYREAFDVVFCRPGEEVAHGTYRTENERAVELLEESEGQVRLAVRTFWYQEPGKVVFNLTVPLVQAVEYPDDMGLNGHIVRFPYSRTSRWCHPLLICPLAEAIATDRQDGPVRFKNAKPGDWDFQWINWYGRVNRAITEVIFELMASQRRPTANLVHMYFRRGISRLITPAESTTRPSGWAENGANNGSGLPMTDDSLIIRHMHELRLGYPDCPNNDELYEKLKMKYVQYVDPFCDVTWTGKNHTGREVGRIFQGDAKSFVTGREMVRLLRAFNPLGQIGSPARVCREDRSCAGWQDYKNPVAPPLTAKGVGVPKPFRNKITTLITLVADLPGFNTFTADDQDLIDYPGRVKDRETISLDGLLVTRTGRDKMMVLVKETELKTAEEFETLKEELQELPGFQSEQDLTQVEILDDGTGVFTNMYRYSFNRERRCRFDKVKCLMGGIKGITRPIKQLTALVGEEHIPIDMVISEQTALSKGANDLFIGALLGLAALLSEAGTLEIDPEWTQDELISKTETLLAELGLPTDGRFPIYSSVRVPIVDGKEIDEDVAATLHAWGQKIYRKTKRVLVGYGIVGPLPFVCAQETEQRQSSVSRGMSLNSHSRVLGDVPMPISEGTRRQVEEIADFFYTYNGNSNVSPELEEAYT